MASLPLAEAGLAEFTYREDCTRNFQRQTREEQATPLCSHPPLHHVDADTVGGLRNQIPFPENWVTIRILHQVEEMKPNAQR